MRSLCLISLVVLSFLSFCSAQPPDPPRPDVYWYTQKFDHFNATDDRYFTQQYLVYDKYYNGSGPIFFCPGGESAVIGGYNHNGFMFELGEKVGAFLLFPEHRFYGDSLPRGPVDSYLPENIKLLQIEQAMEDYKEIIEYVKVKFGIGKDHPDTKTPLIAFGGSYPGDLAVWMRVGYPSLVDGSMGASAPLRYVTGAVPGGAFFETVTKDFTLQHPECADMMRASFSAVAQLWSEGSAGVAKVVSGLRLCESPTPDAAGLRLLNLWAENAFANLGMEDYPYPLDDLPAFPMLSACQVLYDTQRKAMQNTNVLVNNNNNKNNNKNEGTQVTVDVLLKSMSESLGVYYNASGELKCFNISEEYYPCADITGCGGGVGDPNAMSWDYQSCTELIANVDTNNKTDMFPPAPYDFKSVAEYCMKQWNVVPNPGYIPSKYNYTTTTRLILSNGVLDPWSMGGVLPELCPVEKDMYCPLIPNAAHHLDLRGTDPVNDPPEVTLARQKEAQVILDWLDQLSSLPA
eukprot:CAMPEP_0174260868 /NCGR_PEP_ID=MMETSP0439-20130205/10800_1 /TAXON_ID=0 /ORGANISM="Stereomyxa ramosa, Strain Chinc5" /LENGTH=516 /DNA_ID=CAMNT_0015345219 /DNA_START=36 /DNA_END=1586 /DNA_ORIENTATION=+